jgi:hypothetical protein
MNENETKIFNCDLNDSNLFSCILEELNEEDLNPLSTNAPIVHDKTLINCLNATLVNCLRNNKEELEFPRVQLHIVKNRSNDWIIDQINIVVNKLFDDAIIYQKVNQCLKFVKNACKIDESIQFSIIQSEIKEELTFYKIKLTEIDQLLHELKDDKLKQEKLFSLFKNMKTK